MSWRLFWLITFVGGTVLILALDKTESWWLAVLLLDLLCLCIADWRAETRKHNEREATARIIQRNRDL